jgi:hypothetical protein
VRIKTEMMNADEETAITFKDEIPVLKYIRFLPAGQTSAGFRKQPLVQFYAERMVDRGREIHTNMRTVGLDDVVEIKGLKDAQIREIVQEIRHNRQPEPPRSGVKVVAKTRRRNLKRKK